MYAMPKSGEDLLQVGVFYGGPSSEHDVSCASAKNVLRHLRGDRYAVHAIGVSKTGRFTLLPRETLEAVRGAPLTDVAIDDRLPVAGLPVELLPNRADGSLSVVAAGEPGRLLARVDVAFPVMHGAFGEDGVFQGLLEAYGVRYVGCGVGASAIGMDKVAMKRAFVAEGIPVAPYVVLTAEHLDPVRDRNCDRGHDPGRDPGRGQNRSQDRDLRHLLDGLRWPVFVKPARGGSSIGVFRVTGAAGLEGALELALACDDTVIVEQAVADAREIDCGVLASPDGDLWTSLPAEIDVEGGLLDFRQKYEAVDARLTVPADLPPDVVRRMRALAVKAFAAVDAFGLARVDFLWDEKADELYVCEINTMPGFTARSSFARAWDASGVPLGQLLSRLIDQALVRPVRFNPFSHNPVLGEP